MGKSEKPDQPDEGLKFCRLTADTKPKIKAVIDKKEVDPEIDEILKEFLGIKDDSDEVK